MKAAVVGDLHLIDDRLDGPRGQVGILDRVASEIAAADPDVVLILGDLTGQTIPHKATPRERNALIDFIRKIGAAAPTIVIRGNHDYPGDFSFLNNLRADNDVIFVEDKPEVVQVEGGSVMCLPWIDRACVRDPEDYEGGVREIYRQAIDSVADEFRGVIKAGGRTIVIGHVAIAEGAVTEGQPSVPTKDPVVPLAEILRDGIFSAGFFGHYHDPQDWLKAGGCYVGSVFVSSFSEPAIKSWVLHDAGRTTRRPIDQPPKITIEFDPIAREATSIRPAVGGGTVAGVAAYLRDHEAHVKLVPRYWEDDAVKAQAGIADVRASIAGPKVISVRIEPDVLRQARVRDGAIEVSQATALRDKVTAAFDVLDPAPTKPVRKRALELLSEVESEVDGASR